MRLLMVLLLIALASGGALAWLKCGNDMQTFIEACHVITSAAAVVIAFYKLAYPDNKTEV